MPDGKSNRPRSGTRSGPSRSDGEILLLKLFGKNSPFFARCSEMMKDQWVKIRSTSVEMQDWFKFVGTGADTQTGVDVEVPFKELSPVEWVFLSQIYYLLIVQSVAFGYLNHSSNEINGNPYPTPDELISGHAFYAYGLTNLGLSEYPSVISVLMSGLQNVVSEAAETARKIDFAKIDGDIFSPIYESLIPGVVRHRWGEHYTPEWLVSHMMDAAGYEGKEGSSLIDPSCGSGVFLMEALRRCMKNGHGQLPACRIVGMDINPLAVAAARVNYLVTSRYACPSPEMTFEVPIYLRDLILSHNEGLFSAVSEDQDLGQFDFVVGNPPWINWESISNDYRQATMSTWKEYGLFSHGGMDTILGKGKKDFSTLMTLVSADRLLRNGGKMAFLITQSVFKSGGAAEGFRSFVLPDGTPIKVTMVEDLSQVKPFPDAANRTAILYLEKGSQTAYPVSYRLWTEIPDAISSQPVEDNSIVKMSAEPVSQSDVTSPWLTYTADCGPAIHKVLGSSTYRAREGANTGGANGILWVDVVDRPRRGEVRIRNIAESSRNKIEAIECIIEADLVYPLLKNRDVDRWHAVPSTHIVMTQDPKTRKGISERVMGRSYPKTLAYLERFRSELGERKAYKRYFKETDPFYTMFNVGEYTFADIKVVWRRFGDSMKAAVVAGSDRSIIPQETVTMVACRSLEEAWFLAGILNSRPVEYAVASFSMLGGKSFAGPNLLNYLDVPCYEGSSKQLLIAMVAQKVAESELAEEDLNQAVGNYYDITRNELGRIERAWGQLRIGGK